MPQMDPRIERYFMNPTKTDIGSNIIFNHTLARPWHARLVKGLGLKGNEHVLEFGSGSGGWTRHLAKVLSNGGKVTCIDISEPWMEVAKKKLWKFDNIEFRLGDITAMGVPNETFDLIFIYYVMHDIGQPLRQPIVLTLVRTLKSGGRVFLREPTKTGHGMPVEEIRGLMVRSGLVEETFTKKKNWYAGYFQKKSNMTINHFQRLSDNLLSARK